MARPTAFNKSQAIETATQLFWQQGYNNTGIANLVDSMGIKPSSLYAAFGSKQELFFLSLEQYANNSLGEIETTLNDNELLKGLTKLIEDTVICADKRGCLLVNSMLELGRHQSEVATLIESHLKDVEKAIYSRLELAKSKREIDEKLDSTATASVLIVQLWGLRVLQQTQEKEQKLGHIIHALPGLLGLK